jgi:hypothetical protein
MVILGTTTGLMTTDVPDDGLTHPLTETTALYVPDIETLAELITGFWLVLLKEGPLQLYVPPATEDAKSDNELPSQTGPLLLSDGAAGIGFTFIVMPADVAYKGLAHPEEDVMIQVTVWPFVNAEVENVALFVPTPEPFTCH